MRRASACLLLAACAVLAACKPEYQEVVVHECIMDGQDADYCQCQADGMKQALGVKRYAVFTDFILLGGTGKATRDDVLRLMDRHKMSPEDIAATQAAINEAMPLVHAYCNQ